MRWAALVIALALGACATMSEKPGVQRLVVFGDSTVDDGNAHRMTNGVQAAAPNWRGRYSNGPVVVEYLAKDLGARLENYAVGGATTGDLASQVDEFLRRGGTLRDGDIVLVWAGSNDVDGIDVANRPLLRERLSTAAANLEAVIARLRKLGATRFLIVTRIAHGRLVGDNDLSGGDLDALVDATSDGPGADIVTFDAYEAVRDMEANPARYGLTNTKEECITVKACISESYDKGLDVANGFVHWDGAHYTTRAHRIMGGQLLQVLR